MDKLTYVVVRKIAQSVQEKDKPYGMIIRLRLIGRDGEMFNVYKFRTMHPYAEFLQEYIYGKDLLAAWGI